ncbi:hypothetical protein HPB48_005735 [Haemaphysalis longicornis]|uniref:Uncharacterized protein n=1 Tax=Haemaphysalis longicornis TaxID=44386 RepID=A0A9J6FBV8_HAELO|nr:hypothetical protein HPB48_005735 [Haemaphysalis longicornis]
MALSPRKYLRPKSQPSTLSNKNVCDSVSRQRKKVVRETSTVRLEFWIHPDEDEARKTLGTSSKAQYYFPAYEEHTKTLLPDLQ